MIILNIDLGVNNKSTLRNSDLTMHNGLHTNEKPYKCSQYEKTLLSIYPMYKTWRHGYEYFKHKGC